MLHAWEHLGLPLDGAVGGARVVLSFFPGVPIFFVISGFLISRSWERSHDLSSYLRNRFIRIYPALWVAFGVSLLLVGTMGALPLGEVTTMEFWAWVAAQLTIAQFYNPGFLRGFGVGVLNGSLWTIPVELAYYAFLPVLYVLVIDRFSRRTGSTILAVLFAASFGVYVATAEVAGVPRSLTSKLLQVTLAPHLFMFLFGMLLQRRMQLVRRFLAGRAMIWLAAFLGFMAVTRFIDATNGWIFPPLVLAQRTLLALLTLACAYTGTTLAQRFLGGHDLSYGAYLYHMPVINLLVELDAVGRFRDLALVLVATLLLAGLSWRLIEHPVLRRKRRAMRPV